MHVGTPVLHRQWSAPLYQETLGTASGRVEGIRISKKSQVMRGVRDVASWVSLAKEGLVVLPGAGKERTAGNVPQEDVFEAVERETVPVTA